MFKLNPQYLKKNELEVLYYIAPWVKEYDWLCYKFTDEEYWNMNIFDIDDISMVDYAKDIIKLYGGEVSLDEDPMTTAMDILCKIEDICVVEIDEDTEYQCTYCGAINDVADIRCYDCNQKREEEEEW